MPDERESRCRVDELEAGGLSHEAALEAARRESDAKIAEFGWVAHLVFGDPDTPFGFNAHSHGLEDGYGHPDFQIVMSLPTDVAHEILIALSKRVMAGDRFVPGISVDKVIKNFDVGFAAAIEDGRPVLRVILPDKQGRLARDEIAPGFARQYDGTK